jgi:hypothetical protein
MKIDFDSTINDLTGKPVVIAETKDTLTLKSVCLNALMSQFPDEAHLPGEKKVERLALAMRIHEGGELEMTPEDAAELKRLIGKAFWHPLTVGRAWDILNG